VEGVQQTGRARTINREKLQLNDVLSELNDPQSFRSKVFYPYLNLIKIRRKQPAFHPNADFEICEIDPQVFAIRRSSADQTIYAVSNISSSEVTLSLTQHGAGVAKPMTDLISGVSFTPDSFKLKAYQYIWLTSKQ